MHRRSFLRTALTLAGAAVVPGAGNLSASEHVLEGLDPATGLFADDRRLGNPEAKAVLIEYASLSCPHCAEFNNDIVPRLKSEWIDTGKALYVYRHYPLNAPALWGAMLSECLEGERFFGFIDLLYRQQAVWLAQQDVAAALRDLATLAGFDQVLFERCVNDEAMMNKIIDRMEYGQATYGIQGTPTVLVNGEKAPAEDYDALSEALAEAAA